MADPIMHTIPLICPDCGRQALGVRPQGATAHNLPEGFHSETRDGERVVVCKCGGIAFPPKDSN